VLDFEEADVGGGDFPEVLVIISLEVTQVKMARKTLTVDKLVHGACVQLRAKGLRVLIVQLSFTAAVCPQSSSIQGTSPPTGVGTVRGADGSLPGNVWVQELGGGGVFGLRPMANFSSM
jgi:hypothetical protein